MLDNSPMMEKDKEDGFRDFEEKEDATRESNQTCIIASLVVSLLVLIVTIVTLVYTISAHKGAVGDRKETIVDKIIKDIIGGSLNYILPTRFGVDKSFIIPPTNQMQRGTCWDFSSMMLLESQYRHQGIKQGYLQPNEVVNFSKQAFGAWIGQQCEKTHNGSKACKHGGFAHHSTEDHKADAFYYFAQDFKDLTKSVLPESVCPYIGTEDPETDYQCPGMDEALKQNPIEFTIKGIKSASDVYHTKKLLVENQRTLVIGAPLANMQFWANCDSDAWKNDTRCSDEKKVPCPAGADEGHYCASVVLEGRTPDGTFMLVDDYNRSLKMGGHAMNVVGYNDDWVYRSRHAFDDSLANLKGGFILHNSWRNNGHSFDYLMGRRSEENEAVICPNHKMSMNWIPATLDCVKENNGDLTKCGTEYKFVRGKGLANHADQLNCTNAQICNTSRIYALSKREDAENEDAWLEHLYNGFDRVRFISFNPDGSDIKYEYIEKLPFHYLQNAFAPANPTLVDNDIHQCGFYMMPYQVVEMMNRKNWANLDNFHVSDIEVEFTPSSYVNGPGSDKFNTTLLKLSTWKFDETEFDGPLPYKYVY